MRKMAILFLFVALFPAFAWSETNTGTRPELLVAASILDRKIIRGDGYGDVWAVEIEVKNKSDKTAISIDPFNFLIFYVTDGDKEDAQGNSAGLISAFARPFPPVLENYSVRGSGSAKDLDALRSSTSSLSVVTLGPLRTKRLTFFFNVFKAGIDTGQMDLSYLAYSANGDSDRAIFLTTLDKR